MKIQGILAEIVPLAKDVGLMLWSGISWLAEKLGECLEPLHIRESLAQSRLAEMMGIEFSYEQFQKLLSIILSVAIVLSVMSICEKEEKAPSSSGSSNFEDCWRCGGSGNCDTCGGDGRKLEWMGDQYIDVRCTSCIGGRCRWCN